MFARKSASYVKHRHCNISHCAPDIDHPRQCPSLQAEWVPAKCTDHSTCTMNGSHIASAATRQTSYRNVVNTLHCCVQGVALRLQPDYDFACGANHGCVCECPGDGVHCRLSQCWITAPLPSHTTQGLRRHARCRCSGLGAHSTCIRASENFA